MDADQARRVEALHVVVQRALHEAIDAKSHAHEVMMAIIAQAIAVSRQIAIGEDEFFDLVVKMYEWVHVQHVEIH
jgi:hypothetical protein